MTKVLKLARIGMALWTIAAHAQQTTGTITGTVTDTSDAAMAQAAVRLIDSGTGVQRNTTTADNGDFAFRLLSPGIYSVDVSIPGFKTFQQTGIIVEADRSLALPIRLELGAVSERVTIEAVTPLLEPNTSSLGTDGAAKN